MLDRYHFAVPKEVLRGELRPLRMPEEAAAAQTTSISRSPEAYAPLDGIQPSAAEVFDRPLPATEAG